MPSRSARQAGRSPRVASNERRRGSRRGERSTSSSSDDPDDGDPEPHRLCECGCGSPIDHKRPNALYLNGTHKSRGWRDRKAARDLTQSRGDPDPSVAWRQLTPCRCGTGAVIDTDPEGDRFCFWCARWLDPSHLHDRNGHEAEALKHARLMRADTARPPWVQQA